MNNIDKFTKVILTVIALALSVIALNPWLQPVTVSAAQDNFQIELYLGSIQSDVSSIESGVGRIRRSLR